MYFIILKTDDFGNWLEFK